MSGRAAMIAVLLAPTASIARHDDHRTDANPVRCFNVAVSLPRYRADATAHGRPVRALRLSKCYCILREVTYRGQRVCNFASRGTRNPRNVSAWHWAADPRVRFHGGLVFNLRQEGPLGDSSFAV
jgi:hypothetical protein